MIEPKRIDSQVESWKVAAGRIVFKKTDGNLYLLEAQENAEPQRIYIIGSIESYELTDEMLTVKTIDGNLLMASLKG